MIVEGFWETETEQEACSFTAYGKWGFVPEEKTNALDPIKNQ